MVMMNLKKIKTMNYKKKYKKILKEDNGEILPLLNQILIDMCKTDDSDTRYEIYKQSWDIIAENVSFKKDKIIK